jgi:rod shape-determining protein MreD
VSVVARSGVPPTISESPWLRAPLVVALALALQASFAPELRVLEVAPELLLLAAVSAGLSAGPTRGAVFGFVTGLVYDLVLQTPFGLSALVYASAAYTVGFFQVQLSQAAWWVRPLVVGAASAAAVVAYALVGTVIGVDALVEPRLLLVAAVVFVENTLLAPAALWLTKWALAPSS